MFKSIAKPKLWYEVPAVAGLNVDFPWDNALVCFLKILWDSSYVLNTSFTYKTYPL